MTRPDGLVLLAGLYNVEQQNQESANEQYDFRQQAAQ